jgi:hypothetical protein
MLRYSVDEENIGGKEGQRDKYSCNDGQNTTQKIKNQSIFNTVYLKKSL